MGLFTCPSEPQLLGIGKGNLHHALLPVFRCWTRLFPLPVTDHCHCSGWHSHPRVWRVVSSHGGPRWGHSREHAVLPSCTDYSGAVQHCTMDEPWQSMAPCSTLRVCTTANHGTTQQSTAWSNPACCGMAQAAQHSTARHGAIQLKATLIVDVSCPRWYRCHLHAHAKSLSFFRACEVSSGSVQI